MLKLLWFPVLLVAACLIAGAYGALHNQISFTVSPDYFFAFKFEQFAIAEPWQNRVGASIVGWRASWWMGLIIGTPVLLTALIVPGSKAYVTHGLLALAVVAGTAFVIGIGALLYACFTISAEQLPAYWYPPGEVDRVAFARAGTMHNFSYLGGMAGIVTGCAYLIVARFRMRDQRRALSAPAEA